jgi:hypothetical protein
MTSGNVKKYKKRALLWKDFFPILFLETNMFVREYKVFSLTIIIANESHNRASRGILFSTAREKPVQG